jgi:hypothetical protein
MGDEVNVAARLQSLAEPGTIYLSEATHRLAQGQIETTPQGERQLKGKAEFLKVYKLTGLRDSSRFAAAIERGLSPYVGRERELEVLEQDLEASVNSFAWSTLSPSLAWASRACSTSSGSA